MTDDERYGIKANVARFGAIIKQLDVDDERRSIVARLFAKAEEVLAADFKKTAVQHIGPRTARSGRRQNGAKISVSRVLR